VRKTYSCLTPRKGVDCECHSNLHPSIFTIWRWIRNRICRRLNLRRSLIHDYILLFRIHGRGQVRDLLLSGRTELPLSFQPNNKKRSFSVYLESTSAKSGNYILMSDAGQFRNPIASSSSKVGWRKPSTISRGGGFYQIDLIMPAPASTPSKCGVLRSFGSWNLTHQTRKIQRNRTRR
jgi:hypothetical protein